MIFRAENIYILKQVLLAHFFLLRNFMLSQGYLRCSFKTHSDQSETSVLFYFFVFVFFEQVVKARKGSPRNNISCYIWYHVLSHMISCGFIIWFYRKYIYIYLKYCSVYIIYIYIYANSIRGEGLSFPLSWSNSLAYLSLSNLKFFRFLNVSRYVKWLFTLWTLLKFH